MTTSIHIAKDLLAAVDRRARKLKLSRNRFIVKVLEEELSRSTEWSPGFFEELMAGAIDQSAVSEMMEAILSGRTRKGPPSL
jgi:metal-responsive CopG/Arc/MetJ family transcriptional regulator